MSATPYIPPALSWTVPIAAPGKLKIPTYFPDWTAPPVGFDPRNEGWWWPMNAAQQEALCSPAELLLFGGQSGGGKSDFLVGDAMQEYRNPALRGLLLRESLGELEQIADRMEKAYLPLRARYRQRTGGGQWTFPAGGRIRFGYLASDGDLKKYRGNPKSWLGIDESGLHPVNRVRQMIAWLAAPEGSGLRVRGRMASNPGGEGHGWQMSVFLRNRCPLHFAAERVDSRPQKTSVVAGKVYCGTAWSWPPTPAQLVHKTVAFFPASLYDNPFYGRSKEESLLSQTQEIQMQLLYGCWCNAESLYFGFLTPEWMPRFQEINDQWWWNHFISIDYGYGNSSAAAGRFSVDESGRVFGTAEIVEKKMGAVDFAKKVCEAWVKPRQGDERTRFLFVTLDPANDSHTGNFSTGEPGKSNFELMAEVFAEYGIPCIKSHKSPTDNAQVLYHGLSNRFLMLTDGMRDSFNAVATRVIDERRAVKKIHGDPDDDRYDMVSYAYNTWLVETVKPERMKIIEEAQAMRKRGHDETTIARYSLQAAAKLAQKEKKLAQGLPIGGKRVGALRVPKT